MIILHLWASFQTSETKYHADKTNGLTLSFLGPWECLWRREIYVYNRSSRGWSNLLSRQLSSPATYLSAVRLYQHQAWYPNRPRRTAICQTSVTCPLDMNEDLQGIIINTRLSSIPWGKILQAALLGAESGGKRCWCLHCDSEKLKHEDATDRKMRKQQARSHTELVDWQAMIFVLEKYLRWLE